MLNHQRYLWQRRILLVGIALVSSLLLNLLLAVKAPTQEAVFSANAALRLEENTVLMPPRFQGKIVRKVNLSSERKVIALTFDDGPSANTTPEVLNILRENDIRATFFLVGKNLKNSPEIGQQLVAEGHAVGNHTWHHWRRLMTEFTATREIEDTARLIQEITGVKTSLFRPPNGYLYNGLVDYARQRKDVVVMWSVSSDDWRGAGVPVEKLVDKVLRELHPGAIALMHDGDSDRQNMLQALPIIIEQLTQRGYEFVTVPELLQIAAQDLN